MTVESTIVQTISQHWGAIAGTSIGGMLFNSIVDALPAKDTQIHSIGDFFRVAYAFVFDTIHNFASIRSGHVPVPNPTQPSQTAN